MFFSPLQGFIELDDAYLGGERSGGKVGRGAAGKTPFIAAVGTTDQSVVVKCFRSNPASLIKLRTL